jgi:predicted nucleic acid-binding protein
MRHVLVDTNVLLDVWLRREAGASAAVIKAGAEGILRLYVTPVILANTHYFLAQMNKKEAARSCDAFLDIAKVVSQPGDTLRQAFQSAWADTEDAMHYFAAIKHDPRIGHLVTNNVKHFKLASGLEVLSPEGFVSKYFQ